MTDSPRRNVVTYKQVMKHTGRRLRYAYVCELECGHTQRVLTEPGAKVHCRDCAPVPSRHKRLPCVQCERIQTIKARGLCCQCYDMEVETKRQADAERDRSALKVLDATVRRHHAQLVKNQERRLRNLVHFWR